MKRKTGIQKKCSLTNVTRPRTSGTTKTTRSSSQGVHYFVGGATKLYGAALFRFRENDFGTVQHHDGVSPEWPVKYDTWEPYYTQAEDLFHVHGHHGDDPTDPRFSQQLKHAPVAHEPRIQQIHDKLLAAGYHPSHAPTAILLDEHKSCCQSLSEMRYV